MTDLLASEPLADTARPLPDRLRPRSPDEVIGQTNLLAPKARCAT